MKLIKTDQVNDKSHWLKLRAEDITSTECSALFGLSPYQTEYELWHRKKNNEIVSIEENERMKWGNRLEHAIAWGIAEDNQWTVEPMKDYGRSTTMRAGSSFDFKITKVKDSQGNDEITEGLLEIKNVDGLVYRNTWDLDNGEAPAHIEIQCQHQLMITGYKFMYLGALVGGNMTKLIKRVPDPEIIAQIEAKIRKFWGSIEGNECPKVDFERDAEFIKSLYATSKEGKEIEGNEKMRELAVKYKSVAAEIKILEKKKDGLKAELLTNIDDASKVVHDEFSISAGMTKESKVAYTKQPFRNFKVYLKKEKSNED